MNDNHEIAKKLDQIKKNSSQKLLGIKHSLVKRIQVSSNEGCRPFPRKDNNDKVKIH